MYHTPHRSFSGQSKWPSNRKYKIIDNKVNFAITNKDKKEMKTRDNTWIITNIYYPTPPLLVNNNLDLLVEYHDDKNKYLQNINELTDTYGRAITDLLLDSKQNKFEELDKWMQSTAVAVQQVLLWSLHACSKPKK